MTSPDSTTNHQDPERTEGVGGDGLDVTSDFSSQAALDATGQFDSKTRQESADVTAAFDSSGSLKSGSGSFQDRFRSSNSQALIGSVIGGYRIIAPLGQGGMGRVFRADDSSGRPVAIKLLSPDLARSSEALARFKQEGLIASQINHARCVFVHRVDEADGTPFIAMELMTGRTLKDLVTQKGPLPFAEAVRLILQCIEGLVEAHSRGMIHRDIKPANCYLDERGDVKVGDFGLARSLVSDSELTQTGAFIGTPLFASPEQLIGQSIDARSDIYSLTATLYFLLAGKAPFESPHAAQVIARIASSDPPPFSTVDIEVPDELERIVMKGLSRDPSKRFQTFVEMQTELTELLAPKPETATLPRRVIAAIADHFLLSMLIGTASILFLPKWAMEDTKIVARLSGALITALYFLIAEGFFATSIGKAAMRIRIADARTGRRPSWVRVLSRVSIYTLISLTIYVVFVALLYAAGLGESDIVSGLALAVATPLTWALYLVTWRRNSRGQMLHDCLSGTECLIPAPPIVQHTQLELPSYQLPIVVSKRPLPESLGRFRICHEIDLPGAENSIRWLVGDDPQLERSVWIAVTQDLEIDFEQQQSSKDPSTRLRFIEQGTEGSQRWYAYVAPEGIPLQECVQHGVHFAWPVTSFVYRQLLSHFHSVKSNNAAVSISKLSDWWIDRAGRLSIVSLDSVVGENVPAACVEQIQSENAANYRSLIQNIGLLALPPNHRMRRRQCSKLNNAKSCLLAREDLPPLRSLRFCESIASGKFTPSLETLESNLTQLNRGPHSVTSKARFFNAVLSFAFTVPILAIIGIMLIIPSIVFLFHVRESLQSVATLDYIAHAELEPEAWWKGASQEQKKFWRSEIGRQKIGQVKAKAQSQLAEVYANIGKLERTIINNIPAELAILSPPNYRLSGGGDQVSNRDTVDEETDLASSQQAETKSSETSIRDSQRNVNFSLSGNKINSDKFVEAWSESQMTKALQIANSEDLELTEKGFGAQLGYACLAIVGAIAIWNWLTFGGVAARLTGICFVNRDGTRMGILKSALRSLIVFAPVLILLSLLACWPLVAINDIWWTNQIKVALYLSPLVYLACTLVWNNCSVADILARTTAIPR